jgi:hypothetical protein
VTFTLTEATSNASYDCAGHWREAMKAKASAEARNLAPNMRFSPLEIEVDRLQ